MDSEIYLLISATVIAVAAIYFIFVRKQNPQAKHLQTIHDRHDGQQ